MHMGSHSFKIICPMYRRRVIGSQTIYVTSRKEDRGQIQIPLQSHTSHFQMFSRLGLNKSLPSPFLYFLYFLASPLQHDTPPLPCVLGTLAQTQMSSTLGHTPR